MEKTILFAFLLLLMSCSNTPSYDITQLEKDHLANPTTDAKKQLVLAYQDFIDSNTDNKEQCSMYSNKLATVQHDLNQYADAATTLTNAIKNYPASGSVNDNIQAASSLFINHLYKDENEAIQKFSELFSDQSSMKSTLNNIITNLKNTMFDSSSGNWDRKKVVDYVSLARMYGGNLPKDPESSVHLYKAAEIANARNMFPKALAIYDYMLARPNDFTDVAKSLFLKAYTLDEHLKKYDEAKVLYEKIVNEHPKSNFAEGAKASIGFLGKSTEEIIKSFEEKKKK